MGSPFGVKGFVRARSLSGEYEHLANLKEIILCGKEKKEISYQVEEITRLSNGIALKLRGVDSPETAKQLAGAEIIVSRDHAAPLEKGEFYIEDLRGLDVFFQNEKIGEICDIIEGGGGDLIEIKLLSGEKRFVPFRNEFFGEIEPEKGRAELLNVWILE